MQPGTPHANAVAMPAVLCALSAVKGDGRTPCFAFRNRVRRCERT